MTHIFFYIHVCNNDYISIFWLMYYFCLASFPNQLSENVPGNYYCKQKSLEMVLKELEIWVEVPAVSL